MALSGDSSADIGTAGPQIGFRKIDYRKKSGGTKSNQRSIPFPP